MKIDEKLKEIGIKIPPASPPGALYEPVKQEGTTLYVSGQVPMINGIPQFTGKIGSERSLEYGQEAARLCIVNMLAALKYYLGDLDQITSVVKLLAFVSSEVGFDKQHLVINAASQMLMDVFGPQGAHARSAVGVNQLPMDCSVEIEGIFSIRKED